MTYSAYKTVLITGAAHRIGRAIALDLATEGWNIGVHYNSSRETADELVATINNGGGRAIALKADLSVEAEVASLIPTLNEEVGPVTALINNASVFENDTIETATRSSWDEHMEVNLRAPFLLTQMLAEQLPESLEGNIINLIDQRVWSLTPFFTTYTLSKAGLWALTQTSAQALAPKIRVNGIGPGPVLKGARQTDEDFDRQWAATPMRRKVMAQEICDAVRFIIEAPSMTGQMIALDGGQHLGWGQVPNTQVPKE